MILILILAIAHTFAAFVQFYKLENNVQSNSFSQPCSTTGGVKCMGFHKSQWFNLSVQYVMNLLKLYEENEYQTMTYCNYVLLYRLIIKVFILVNTQKKLKS